LARKAMDEMTFNITLQVKLPHEVGAGLAKRIEKLRGEVDENLKKLEKEIEHTVKRAQAGAADALEKLPKLRIRRGELEGELNKLTMAAILRAGAKEMAKVSDKTLRGLMMDDEVCRGAPKRG
jgi:hypothetical protein